MCFDDGFFNLPWHPIAIIILGNIGEEEIGRVVLRIVPEKDSPGFFFDWPSAQVGAFGDSPILIVGDFDTCAFCVIEPSVEGAADAIAFDLAADADMGAEMGAVGVKHDGAPIFCPKGDEVALEIGKRDDAPFFDFVRGCREKPSAREALVIIFDPAIHALSLKMRRADCQAGHIC